MAFRILKRLRDLLDVDTSGAVVGDALVLDADGETWVPGTGGGGSGAPDDVDYLVGTASGDLSAEIVVGASPGGELGGTWASPTVDATHSGSTHAAVQAAAEATAASGLSTHSADTTAVHGITDTSALALAANVQPLDSDLTALAALTTSAFGRGLLELANQAALLSAAGAAAASHAHAGEDVTSGTIADARIAATIARDSEVTSAISALSSVYQPLDSDLTSVAALTTTAFGRSVLALADQAALLAAAGAAAASHAHAGEDVTSGTVADARVASTITRDSEVASLAALVKLDDFAAPDDNTDLDASTAKHGLLKKLPGDTTTFLRADGSFAAPAGGAVATDAIFDAKGDLAVGTGADTAAKLTVGTNTYVLVADSSQSTGLKWRNIGWTEIIKASDENVISSTTLQADDELLFTTANGGVYEIELVVIYVSVSGGGTPDLKFLVAEDATARGTWGLYGNAFIGQTDSATGAVGLTNTGATAGVAGTAATNRVLKIESIHVGAGGAYGLSWAQNTSAAANTTVKAGSVLRYRRVL